MTSQHTQGWFKYDNKYYRITRGFLLEAINQPDLVEGVWWLSLARTGAFSQVERVWQHIK
jgi:hypothetical protein